MASDEKILDELHFLSWKIEALERKLETSLEIQEDLAANLLREDGSPVASVTAIKKFERRHVSGSTCSEPITSDDEHNSSRIDGAISKDLENELERSTSYLIIPVGSYKDNDSYSFTTEKQTFIWSEMGDNARKCITCKDALNGDNDGATENEIDANQRDLSIPSLTNSQKSFANQVIPLATQSSFGKSEKQMCTQRNERVSKIIPSEDCLFNSRGSHSSTYDPLEGKQEIGSAFDIEYDQEEKIVSTECKDYKLRSSRKYGLTIGIATAKESSQGISLSGINSCKEVDKRNVRHSSGRLQSHFAADEIKEHERAADEQLRPLSKESTTQSTHSSDEATFDQIYNRSSESMHRDNEKYTEYKQSSSDFAPDISAYYTEKVSEPSYNLIYVDSEPLKGGQTNYDFVDTLKERDALFERNPAKLNANLSDASEQSSSTNTEPDRKQAMADYPLLVNNGKYENDVYVTRKEEYYQNGNLGFKQNEMMNCDAVASNKVIKMQMNHVPEEQSYEKAYYTRKQFDAESLLTNNGTTYIDGNKSRPHIQHVPADVNNNGEAVKAVLFRVDKTKPQYRVVDEHISQFDDQFFGIVGYNNDYKVISTDSDDRVAVHTKRSKSHPVQPSNEQIMRNPHARKLGPHMHNSRENAFESQQEKRISNDDIHSKFHFHSREDAFENHLEKRSPHDDTHSKFPFEPDVLTESGFSETLMSALSDDVFFDSTPNPDLVSQTLSRNVITTNHDAAPPEVAGSESSYSSLTSISSNNGGIYPWKIRQDSLSRQDYNDRKQFAIPNTGDSALERNSRPSSTPSYLGDNETSSDSEPYVRSFRLSPLPRPARTPSLHEQLVGDILGREYTTGHIRVSSPASSVDTSELSMSDSVCECLHQCECQTGIPTAEDFREELKAISTYVLNARKESASLYKKPQVKYYLDEERGDMDSFGGRFERKVNKTVPMLVRVILRLRKHFFGTLDSKTPFYEKSESDVNNNDRVSLEKIEEQTFSRKQRGRKISFSPSAMLLSAIGENSAAEVKEVIEKERMDVNQLSPSGRSLLHKAAAAGDLESIHTLIQYGALVNIVDQDGFPPIHSALKKSHYKCAILLIECGTDIARYTTERIREFMEIRDMTTGHLPVLLKTNL